MNTTDFLRNTSAHSSEELVPYFEQHVAWSVDGKQILAHSENEADLYKEIDRLGLNSADYVIAFVPDPDIVTLGGAGLE